MRRILAMVVIFGFASLAAFAADGLKALEQAEDLLDPYDAGYAFQASQVCPNLTLLRPIEPDIKAQDGFKRGGAMFDHYKEIQQLEGACEAALKLYNSENGKVARVLGAGRSKP